jgi:hypothetical protein
MRNKILAVVLAVVSAIATVTPVLASVNWN